MDILVKRIQELATAYAASLKNQIDRRTNDMLHDDTSHHLIYRVFGISSEEGMLIDEYQNKGRFLYKYAGSFLEEAATLCLNFRYPNGKKTRIDYNKTPARKNAVT
jgi:hypothetical protein